MTRPTELRLLQTKIKRGLMAITGRPLPKRTDGPTFDGPDFHEMYWDEPRIIRLEAHQAALLGFSDLDAEVISKFGIPEWAAPHLLFTLPELLDQDRILIGEDGDDRPIVYRSSDRVVYVLDGKCERKISVGMDGLIFTLVMFAAMVELAIESNRDAFRMNRIPRWLVERFCSVYCSEFQEIYPGGYVEEQIGRLLAP